jgi:peptidylprolyl isomerase
VVAEQRTSKQERRAAAKAAAAQAAQVKKRNQALAGAGAGLAVIAVLVAVFFIARGGGDGEDVGSPALTTTASPSPTAAAEPEPPAATQPPAADFPPVPAGADPALKTKPAVKAGSGTLAKLTVTPLIKGKGPAAKAGQTITVNYVGVTYAAGEEFDASWKRSEPFTFQLGTGGVIPGWDQGLVGATVGSRVQLDIPADLAYGENPQGGAPAGPLRFVVDVLAVQ